MPSLKTMAETWFASIRTLFRKVMYWPQRMVFFSILYLFSFGIAEYLTYYVSNLAGLIFHLAVLFSLIINGAITLDKNQRGLLLALGLVPLIKIISLVMPLPESARVYWYLLISVPIFIGIYGVMQVLKYSFADIGLNRTKPILQAVVASGGFCLGAIGFLILRPDALTTAFNIQTTLSPALILLVSTGFVEEMAFRGVMQRAANALASWGWIYISLIYAVLQTGRNPLIFCLLVLLVSLLFGWVVKKTGCIVGVSLAHGLFNIGLYLVFPFIL